MWVLWWISCFIRLCIVWYRGFVVKMFGCVVLLCCLYMLCRWFGYVIFLLKIMLVG